MKKHQGNSLAAFQKELKRSLPDKTDEELNWKWAFLGGTVVMTITLMDQIDWFNDEGDMGGSADWIIQNLVNYTPPVSRPPSPRSRFQQTGRTDGSPRIALGQAPGQTATQQASLMRYRWTRSRSFICRLFW